MAVNSGVALEKLVGLIQEVLKDTDSTIVYTNARLANRGGSKREFDVLIETKVNNFILKIAIECKDFKRPVSVDKIEAFITKCNRVPDINKKVFVSTSGYQKDAIIAAKEYGVDLYKIEDIDSSTILDWFPIKQLGLRVSLSNCEFALRATEDDLRKLHLERGLCQFIFNKVVIHDLNAFVFEQIKEHKTEIWAINFLELMRNKSNNRVGKITNLPFKLEFSGGAFITNGINERFSVGEITGTVDTWLVETDPDKITSKSFITDDETQANYLSFDNLKYGKMEIVITSNKTKMFYTGIEGTKKELTSLGIYDPKTDKFTPTTRTEDGLSDS
jgi:hypothetical protein